MLTHVILTATRGDQEPTDFVLAGQEQVLIGRCTGCDLRLSDLTVSRRHCLLLGGEAVVVRDLGSLNGTFINGQRLGGRPGDEATGAVGQRACRELHDGDELQVGAYAFWVRLVTDDSPENEGARPVEPELCAACD